MLFTSRTSHSLKTYPKTKSRTGIPAASGRVAAVLLISLLAACRSGVKLDQDASAANAANTEAVAGSLDPSSSESTSADPSSEVQEVNAPVATEVDAPIAEYSIYFDFDQYAVKPAYQALLQKHAQYIKAHPDQQLHVQGFSDERGTPEYNLALAQRRAESVRRALILLGVSASKVEAVSFGKEKPKALGHDETSWAENRRADLTYSR